jgi:alkylation response protein AidB-like acyl-CoA dehydrogenase
MTGQALLVSAERVALLGRRDAAAAEAQRTLTHDVVREASAAGLFHLGLPTRDGGPGISLAELISILSALGQGDGALGWCSMISSTTCGLAAHLPASAAAEIFASSRAVGGVFAPNGRAETLSDGVRLSGRWQWGSGSGHSDWLLAGAMTEDARRLSCLVPVTEVEFHDTWHTVGLRGTGSGDFSLEDVFVPATHIIEVGRSPLLVDDALARFPTFTLLAVGVASVAIGIGRRALDEAVEIAAERTPQFSRRRLAESGAAQAEMARAEARWGSARAYLVESVGVAWDRVIAGDEVTLEQRVRIRSAAAHAASEVVGVADAMFSMCGGAAVYDTSALGRCLRDAHVIPQHIMVSPRVHETLGKFHMGVDLDAGMI